MADNNTQKKCGFCGESVPAGAGRCPYCGSILEVTFDSSYSMDSVNSENNSESENGGSAHSEQNNGGDPGGEPQALQQPSVSDQSPPLVRPPREGPEPRQNPAGSAQDYQRPYYRNRPVQGPGYEKAALSNGLKVFLTILFTVVPGVGQLAGIITAIVFMSAEDDRDRRSFGVALLVGCLILFVLACIGCFILALASTSLPFDY